jgi:hypothetical protein
VATVEGVGGGCWGVVSNFEVVQDPVFGSRPQRAPQSPCAAGLAEGTVEVRKATRGIATARSLSHALPLYGLKSERPRVELRRAGFKGNAHGVRG